jgi:hypothetical protein
MSHIPIPQNFSSLKLLFQLLQKFHIQQQHLDMPTLEKSPKLGGKKILYSPVSGCQEFFFKYMILMIEARLP